MDNRTRSTSLAILLLLATLVPSYAPAASLSAAAAASVRARTLGYILLQVEQHGEAWYVDPVSGQRYYLKDGATAYEMMRTFGLGISESDYARLATGDTTLMRRLKGRIILRVQAHGEAYYVHPNGSVYYLANGSAAYTIMRERSLGITDLDLAAITSAELQLKPYPRSGAVLGSSDEVSTYSGPLSAEEVAHLNAVWIDLLNTERAERGIAPLIVDDRFVTSASAWAEELGSTSSLTHIRPNGQSLGGWLSGFGYNFTSFGENITLIFIETTPEAREASLRQSMDMFLSEEKDNGGHYQNAMNPLWGSAGIGFYRSPYSSSHDELITVFHFGNLRP